jgi:hypothetical protein
MIPTKQLKFVCLTYLCDLLEQMPLNKFHDDAVTVKVDGFRDRKTSIVQRLHVGELFCGRDARKIDPVTISRTNKKIVLLY